MPVLISDSFHSDPRVLKAGNRAVGAWIRMLCWLAQWPEESTIHPCCRRMFDVTPSVVRSLVEAGLIRPAPGGALEPLGEGELWKFYRPVWRRKIPDGLRALVMERDEYRCQKCAATEDLSLDHIVPYSLGGPDTAGNLRVLCRSCNSARGNRMETIDG